MFFDISYVGAFVGGLLSFLSPCVLPLLPPYLCFLAGKSYEELAIQGQSQGQSQDQDQDQDQDQGQSQGISWPTVWASVAFVAGFTLVFTVLGAGATFLGQWLMNYYDVFAMFAGGAIILLGLHFLGVLHIRALMQDKRFHLNYTRASLLTAFVVGMAFAFGWTPCVGPILAAVLAVAATEEEVVKGIWLLLFYSLGIGLPFILAGFFIGTSLKGASKIRRYLPMISKVSGGLLIVTGVLFITGSMADIAFFILEYMPFLSTIG